MIKNVFRPYKNKSTWNLINSMLVLNSCRIPGIVKATPSLLKFSKFIGCSSVSNSFIKNTFFKYFCGGENVSEIVPVMQNFHESGINSILDLAMEETGMEKTDITKLICDSIDIAKYHKDNFVSIKISALEDFKEDIDYTYLNKICEYAKNNKVMVMIDAESSKIQPFIDEIARNLADTWNTDNCVVWNTYQMYLKDSMERLKKDLSNRKNGMGVKLVRGAYMESENPDILHNSIEATHSNYNEGVEHCIDEIHKGMNVNLMLATHNQESILLAMRHIKPSARGNIKFGQLYGMKDDITFDIAGSGYSVYKYIPYGPVITAIPYLIRRAQENSNVLSNLSVDNKLYIDELLCRFY